ncbi:MAG: hypothetical protein AABY26_00865, partial [Nanoarchaeota archaeon]
MKHKIIFWMALMLGIVFASSYVFAAANLAVSAFSCTPSEVKINDQFTCTATVGNTGDATGTLNTA